MLELNYKNMLIGEKKIRCTSCKYLFGLNYAGQVIFCNGEKGKLLDEYGNKKDLRGDFLKRFRGWDCPLEKGLTDDLYVRRSFSKTLSEYGDRFFSERIYLYVHNGCNNNCKFCYRDKKIKNEPTLEDLLKEIKSYGKKFKYLVMLGGEPTLSPHLMSCLELAKKERLKIVLITNGRRFADLEYAKKILAFNIDHLTFSLHSHRQRIHDNITRAKGSFYEMSAGICNVKKINPSQFFRISIVVNRQNYKELTRTVMHAILLGAKEIRFTSLRMCDEADKHKKELFVSLRESSPYMEKSFDLLYKLKYDSWFVDGTPLCPFKRKYWSHFLNERFMNIVSNDYNRKEVSFPTNLSPQCLPCRNKKSCPGIYMNQQKKDFREKRIVDFSSNPYLEDITPEA